MHQKIYWHLVHIEDEPKITLRSKEYRMDKLLELRRLLDCLGRGTLQQLCTQLVHNWVFFQEAANPHHPLCNESFLLHDRQQGASLDDIGVCQDSKPQLPPLKDPCKEGFLHFLKLTTRVIMTRIAGKLLDINVVEALMEGTPMNDKSMWNANGLSSRPIGDTSIPFNIANLEDNGNLLFGSVTPVLNARNTPRWMKNDQSCHCKKWKGKGKTGRDDEDVDLCVHHPWAVPYLTWFKIKAGTNMRNTIECVCFVVFNSYTPLIHSWQLTTKNYSYQFSIRPLLRGWCLCPNLYGSTFLQIFLLNPIFLPVNRNRYSEGMDKGQMTSRGYPNFNSYVKNRCFFVFRMDGGTDRWTVRQRH